MFNFKLSMLKLAYVRYYSYICVYQSLNSGLSIPMTTPLRQKFTIRELFKSL